MQLSLCVVMQRAVEALVSDWMGVLSGLRRLWEAGEVTCLITSPGEEHPPHTPLAALVDAGDFRALVAQLQQSWQAAFAQAESFRQVSKDAHWSWPHAPHQTSITVAKMGKSACHCTLYKNRMSAFAS